MKNTKAGRKTHKSAILSGLMLGFTIIFSGSAYFLIKDKLTEKREQASFNELIKQIESPAADEMLSKPQGDTELDSNTVSRYKPLYEQNADFIGWIYIEDTEVNYPVMLSPYEPDYYLHRDFDKNYSQSGVPFLGVGSTADSNNILIYGHNMKNGTMFADILKYANADFAKAHPIISFDSLTEEAEYEVVAAFYSQVYALDEPGAFRYYNYGGELDSDTFSKYLDEIGKVALYDLGVSLQDGDSLLTLSTCSYHIGDGRFVVVARKVR